MRGARASPLTPGLLKRHLTLLILAALVVGIVVGQLLHDPTFEVTMSDREHAHSTALALFHFLGDTLFLGLLKTLILPLIATSVIVGVTSVGDFRSLGRLGLATLGFYFASMLVAAGIGLVLVTSLRPGDAISHEDVAQAQQTFERSDSVRQSVSSGPEGVLGALQNLTHQIVPGNLFRALADGQTLPVIFFCIVFAIVLTTMGEEGRRLSDLAAAAYTAIMRLVHLVLWLTPLAVGSLLAWTVARIGLESFGRAIGTYMLTVTAGLLVHGLVVLPVALWVFTRENPFRLLRQMRSALLTAIGTDSSSATLPVTMECATVNAGISQRTASFVLPLGATINMDGTALYEAVAVVFMAQVHGIDLSLGQLLLVAITATLAAVGAAGIPSAGLVTMVIVINAVNGSLEGLGAATIPLASIGLILGVDRFLDMLRTAVNVWGDAVAAKVVDRVH